MHENTLATEPGATASSYSGWDVEPVVEQVWKDLGGTVTRPAIRQELADVILSFERAPIQTFVPIFVRRRTVERLRTRSTGIAKKESA